MPAERKPSGDRIGGQKVPPQALQNGGWVGRFKQNDGQSLRADFPHHPPALPWFGLPLADRLVLGGNEPIASLATEPHSNIEYVSRGVKNLDELLPGFRRKNRHFRNLRYSK